MECIGHIQKIMGSRLRQKNKGTVLADGKKLGEKGRLTDNVINDLQNYYGVAIRSNCDSVDKIRTAVCATFFHKKSKHGLCPEGSASWCKHNRAKALIIDPPDMSKGTLPDSVLNAIKPVYNDLAKGSCSWHDPKLERVIQQPHLGEDPENKFCWVVYPKDWSVRCCSNLQQWSAK